MSAARTIDVTHRAAGRRPARDTRTFWRVLLAVIAPLPGVALAVANLLSPSANNANSDAQLNAILAHPGRVEAGMWIGVLFLLGLFPAIVAVLWVCRRHAPRLTAVVGCITLLGAAAGLSIPNSQLPDFVASQKGLDPRTILTLNDNLAKLPVVLITTLLFLLGVVLFGRILLGVLLWRSGVAPRWMASALILAGPLGRLRTLHAGRQQRRWGAQLGAHRGRIRGRFPRPAAHEQRRVRPPRGHNRHE